MKKNKFWAKIPFSVILFALLFAVTIAVAFPYDYGSGPWDNPILESYRLDSGEIEVISVFSQWVQNPDSFFGTRLEEGNCRIGRNTGSNSYFIPTKTEAEWDSFRNNNPSSILLYSCCDRNPSGVYSAAVYGKKEFCGSNNYVPCEFDTDRFYEVKTRVTDRWCAFLTRPYIRQCATMFPADDLICHGENCVVGMQFLSDKNTVRICYGRYNAITNNCDYVGSRIETIDSNGAVAFGHSYDVLNYDRGEPTLGTCAGSGCGDSICASWEDCLNCPQDCGTCPCPSYTYPYSCETNGCYWHNAGSVCSDTDCGDYDDDVDCEDDGCYWDYMNGVCSDGTCSDYSNPFECEDYDCEWHSCGYVCSDTPCSDYYYEYECTNDGCCWDEYSYSCTSGEYY